ncbi:MAG: QueT transporter family protein [Ruminococcus sp.]|nr:QueT transporter family protein [Ruminococcus sp.]
MESLSTRRITRIGVTAAIYVALTLALSSLSYGSVQFRVAEALMLLCLFSKDYVFSLTIGCFIANIFSSVGVIDTVVGTSATLLAGLGIYLLRSKLNLLTASFFPVAFNAVLVGLELRLVLGLPLLASMAGVAAGELVCVTVLGSILFKALSVNKQFMHMISDGHNEKYAG